MGVFFSGTDTTEIIENSEFHNYYFSLIVNNINEMTAKIAFRVKTILTQCEEVSYNDINGKPIIKKECEDETKVEVNIYDCDIVKPFIPDAFTRNRFCDIRTIKLASNANKNKEHLSGEQRQDTDLGNYRPKNPLIKSPNMRAEYDKLTNNFTKVNGNKVAGIPGNLFDTTTPEGNLPIGSQIDGDIRNWMIDLIGNGVQNQLLSQVLGNLCKRVSNGLNIHNHFKVLFERFHETYYNAFPDDPTENQLITRARITMKMFRDNYGERYPTLVNQIIAKITLTVTQ